MKLETPRKPLECLQSLVSWMERTAPLIDTVLSTEERALRNVLVTQADRSIVAAITANHERTAKASQTAGRKNIPLSKQKKIGRDTRLITVVAREYCLSINTVRKYRELFSESTSNS